MSKFPIVYSTSCKLVPSVKVSVAQLEVKVISKSSVNEFRALMDLGSVNVTLMLTVTICKGELSESKSDSEYSIDRAPVDVSKADTQFSDVASE